MNHHSNSLTLSNTTKLTMEFDVELQPSNPSHHLPISYHGNVFDAKVFYKDQGHSSNNVTLDISTLQSSFNGNSSVVEMKHTFLSFNVTLVLETCIKNIKMQVTSKKRNVGLKMPS